MGLPFLVHLPGKTLGRIMTGSATDGAVSRHAGIEEQALAHLHQGRLGRFSRRQGSDCGGLGRPRPNRLLRNICHTAQITSENHGYGGGCQNWAPQGLLPFVEYSSAVLQVEYHFTEKVKLASAVPFAGTVSLVF